jgi:hypothetical protein
MIEDARLGSQHLPDTRRVFSDYDKMLFWILDVHRSKKALAAKFGLASGMAAAGTFSARRSCKRIPFAVEQVAGHADGFQLSS